MDDLLLEEVHRWLTKAQHDLQSARKLALGPEPLLDTAIYHCQQAAEKAAKAVLCFQGISLMKSHDVRHLIARLAELDDRFEPWITTGESLTPYATAYRYPDESLLPDPDEFQQALHQAESFFEFVLTLLPTKRCGEIK
ncbi:MAG: HEPN domain-containing protein [Candidatus Sumerlaeaceae bacterium]